MVPSRWPGLYRNSLSILTRLALLGYSQQLQGRTLRKQAWVRLEESLAFGHTAWVWILNLPNSLGAMVSSPLGLSIFWNVPQESWYKSLRMYPDHCEEVALNTATGKTSLVGVLR